MTLTELRYITAVARYRHFGRAAERCFVSQPTLSIAVRKLEDELGVTLFERGRNEVTLTPVGERVVEQAQRVLEEAEAIKGIAKAGQDQLAGPLELGVIFTVGPYLLPHLIPSLARRAPHMNLIIREAYTHDLAVALKRGELDVIVIALPFQEPGIIVEPVYDETFVVALPASHPWTKRKSIAATDLASETLLLLKAGNCFREQVLEACPACRHEDRIFEGTLQRTLEGSSLETIRQMTASGAGITVLPCSSATAGTGLDGLLAFRPFVSPAPSRRVALAWRKSFPRLQAAEALRQAIVDSPLTCVKKLKKATRLTQADAIAAD